MTSEGPTMKWQMLCVGMLAIAGSWTSALADESAVRHRIMVVEYGAVDKNRIIEVGDNGKVTWEHRPPSICVQCQPLANGNVIYAYGGKPTGVQEVDRQHKVVWNYVSKCEQILACERVFNGNTLAAEQGPCRVVTIDPLRKTVLSVDIPVKEIPAHQQMRCVHALENGNVLVANEADGVVREVAADGRLVWECPAGKYVHEALRLKNGNTLIGCGSDKRIIEVTPDKKTVWELTAADVPELNLTWITSLQVLKNGNYVICNFLRGQEGKGAHAFEITREKKVVWKFADHDLVKTATNIKVLDDQP
jgi:outer membrane protein assembly factor BamB